MNCLKRQFQELYFSEYQGAIAGIKTDEGDVQNK